MNRIKYFWDLSACTSYQSHWVDQFASGITTGGGYFKWVVASNVGIRIKPTGTTTGYWLRDVVDGINVDWCGATHANQTITSLGINQATADIYWGSGATTVASDTPDVAAMNAAFDAAITLGIHKVVFNGGSYYVNKSIQVDKAADLEYHWTIEGSGSEINTTNNNTFSVLKTEAPTDNSEAQQLVSCRHVVQNFKFICQSNQIAIDFGPSYGSEFNNILVEDANIGMRLRFALAAKIVGFRVIDCAYGVRLESGQDAYSVTTYWTGATTSNSQCNHTSFKGCRFYHNTTGTIAIDIRDASGIEIVDCIIEGAKWSKGISLYSQLTTVYTGYMHNIHYECASGTAVAGNSEALFYLRVRAGTFVISAPYGQYPAVLCDSGLSTGGASINIITEKLHYWLPDSNGDMYYNAGNTSYVWINNDNGMLTGAAWANAVAGTAVTLCGGSGCGNNKYYLYAIPR
jgi:hypothetical protein